MVSIRAQHDTTHGADLSGSVLLGFSRMLEASQPPACQISGFYSYKQPTWGIWFPSNCCVRSLLGSPLAFCRAQVAIVVVLFPSSNHRQMGRGPCRSTSMGLSPCKSMRSARREGCDVRCLLRRMLSYDIWDIQILAAGLIHYLLAKNIVLRKITVSQVSPPIQHCPFNNP